MAHTPPAVDYDRLRRLALPANLEEAFGRAALEKGYVGAERLERGRRRQQRLRDRGILRSLGQILLRHGDLSLDRYLELLEDVERTPPGAPRRAVGRYRVLREIGRGGMGVVYEAEDPLLGRRVALKVLHAQGDDPRARDRFRREATIAAKLRHPNIVVVHEFGTAPDSLGREVAFLAMDRLEGETLAGRIARPGTPRDELLRLLEEVGRAVAYAHGRGVIHRDLKPSNVLVERDGRAVLTDFGIARTGGETRLTTSGAVLGTPAYMAPEQILDGPHDARTDVYALGAMLYEVLTGRPPFRDDAPTMLLKRVLVEEPPSPRSVAPSVGRDLEILALKALSKEPARRYPTAQAWVDDLSRCRRGLPIEGRPEPPLVRWGRRLARRKLALGAAALIAALAGTATLAVVREGRAVREELRRRTATALEAALELRRAGRLEEMRRFAAEAASACSDALARGARPAEAHYRLGRMHRALMNDGAAWVEQARALAAEPDYAPALYERAVLAARRHGRRVDAIAEEFWRDELDATAAPRLSRQDRARGDAVALELRRTLKADLDALDPGSAALGEGEALCARGLLAWTDGDMARARSLLEAALRRSPDLEEAYEALAMLEMEQRRHEDSIRWHSIGLQRDQGYAPHREGRAFARLLRALELSNRGAPADDYFQGADEDYGQAVALGAPHGRTLVRSGLVCLAWAFHQARAGRDPRDRFSRALAAFEKALEADPTSSQARLWRGAARALWSLCVLAMPTWKDGDDPLGRHDRMLDDLDRAVAAEDGNGTARLWRGVAWIVRGLASGPHRIEAYDRARADLDEVLRRSPERDEAWLWRAVAHKTWGIGEYFLGRDAGAAYRHALEDLGEALRLNPSRADAWTHRGEARLMWATFAMPRRGEDPLPVLQEAMLDLDRSIALNPAYPIVWSYRGAARAECGRLRAERGDPQASEDYRAAIDDFNEALRLNPAFTLALAPSLEQARRALQSPR